MEMTSIEMKTIILEVKGGKVIAAYRASVPTNRGSELMIVDLDGGVDGEILCKPFPVQPNYNASEDTKFAIGKLMTLGL